MINLIFVKRNFHRYKASAKKRFLEFELTFEEFTVLTNGSCYYCGSGTTLKRHRSTDKYFPFIGIDRVNNSIGYTRANSVSCCESCNFFKSGLHREEFLRKIINIYEHRIKK